MFDQIVPAAADRAASHCGTERLIHRLSGCFSLLALSFAVLLPSGQATTTTAATARATTGKIVAGQILNSENKPAGNVEVYLHSHATGKSSTTKTSSTGSFIFTNVTPGAYEIYVDVDKDLFSRGIVVDGAGYAGLRLAIRAGSSTGSGKHVKSYPESFKVSNILPTAAATIAATTPKAATARTDIATRAAEAQTAGTNSGASFQIYSYVQNHNPPHVGFNFSDGHGISENEALTNGGAETYDSRASLTATQDGDSGGTTFVAVPTNLLGGTDLAQSVITGIFNGATAYTYRYGNGTWSLLRQDTVENYAAGPSNATPPLDPANFTITYAESGPQTLTGDIIWVDLDNQLGQVRGNDYYNRGPNPNNPAQNPQFPTLCLDWNTLGAGNLNGCWELYNNLPAPYNVVADAPTPTSDQISAGEGYTEPTSLEIVDNNTEVQGIENYDGYDECNEGEETPVPGDTYELGVWLKGNTTDGVVTAYYTQFNISKQFTSVSNTWQYYTWSFVFPDNGCIANNEPVVAFQLTYNAPGTLEVNGLHVYDTSYPPFQIIPPVLQTFQNYEPGIMRFWSNQSSSGGVYQFWSLDSWLTPEWQNRTSPEIGNYYELDVISEHLPDAFALAKQVGTIPWIIVNPSLSGQEWANLYDYIAAPEGVGYAAKRPSNHPGPYTADFSKIYIEIGNEEWGTQQVPSDAQYGGWANYVTNSATANKSYTLPTNIAFIVNADAVNPSFGSNAIKQTPLASVVDIFNYTSAQNGDLPSAGAPFYESELLSVPEANAKQINGIVAQQQLDALAGFNYTVNVYEEGPGVDNPNITYGDPSLAGATAALDASLYATSQGIQDQGFFLYNLGTGAFTSHNNFAQGFIPHPIWEALQARNQYLNGDSVLTVSTANPTSSIDNKSPLIGAYAFHDANDQVDVAVVSRDFNNTTPVTLNFPATPTGTATLYSLVPPQGGDPSSNNDDGLNIPVNSQALNGVTQSYTFNMPPGSIYIFQVPTTGGWSSAAPLPVAPTVLQANADNSKVSLAWTPVAAASGYNVLRGTQTGGPYTVLPGAQGFSGTSYTDTSVVNGTTYYYVVTATNNAGTSGYSTEASATPNVVLFGYTSVAPPIDGTSNGAWATAPEVAITNYFDINSNVETDQGEFKALWDNNNLYLLATVEDSTLTTSTDVFDGDAVEVYFSATDSKSPSYGPTDFEYGFPYGGNTVTEAKHNATTGVTFGQQLTSNGYQIGIKIPWSTLGVSSPSAGTQYGFDIQVDDAQTANQLFGKFAWWATQNLSFQYPYLFGPAVLSSGSTLPAGTPIPIPNYSFEADTVQTKNDYNTPSDWTFGQTNTYGEDGISQINSSTYGGYILGQDGNNYWVPSDFNNSSNSSGSYGTSTDTLTSQNLGKYAANSIYTLTVALADPADGTPSSTKEIGFQLLADGTPVATLLSNDINQGAAFQDKTLSFNTANNPSVVGQDIAVQLVYTFNGQYNRSAYFDNVRLTTTAAGGGTSSAVNTSTALSISPNSSTLTEGESYTLMATVSPASGSTTPTGNVVFNIGSATQTVSLSNGVATYNGTAPSTTGTLSLSAQYQGNSSFNSSTSSTLSETITSPSGGGSGTQTQVTLSSAGANTIGFTNDNTPFSGNGIDGDGNAYSANQTGSSLTFQGITYKFSAPDQNDVAAGGGNVSIALPSGNYSRLYFLGLGVDGSQTGSFNVNYTTGAPTTLQNQQLSDWFHSQSYSGEAVAATYQYRDNNQGAQNGGPLNIYEYSITLDSSRTVTNLTLPNNQDIVVAAVTLVSSGLPSQISLSGAANVIGITNDNTGFSGNGIDGDGNAYSAQQIGSSFTDSSGTLFNFGSPDQKDVVTGANAPVVALTSGKYSTLKLLGLAVNGGQTGTFTVTYSDNSTDPFPLSLDDWFANPNNLAYGNDETVAASYPYRDNNQGAQSGGPLNLYEYTLGINNGKTVKSLTLPNNQNIVVVAATLLP